MKAVGLLWLALVLHVATAQSKRGPAPPLEYLTEIPHETRTLRVAADAEASPVDPGASFTIFSATGPGSVERVQFAALGDVEAQENSSITLTVDGVRFSTTTGIFFLNKWQADGGLIANNLFATKNLANTYVQTNGNPTNGMGAYRKIYIPYYRSMSITYTNRSKAKASLYTQVDYYSGRPPAGLHPTSQTYFHMYTYPFVKLSEFHSIVFLPPVSGPGQLDSIYLLVAGPDLTPQWLEANPHLIIDSVPYVYGGTEDFFGAQYYSLQYLVHTDEFGSARFGLGSDGVYYTAMYRYFHDFPVVFQTSLSFTWANGQKDEGTPPVVTTAANIVYYTAKGPEINPPAPEQETRVTSVPSGGPTAQ